MSDRSQDILIVAGESSGDYHASLLIRELKKINPGLAFFGIGGDEMRQAGAALLEHVDNMAVMGFTEVITKYPYLRSAMGRIVRKSREIGPARAILVDYPGFNLRLAKKLKRLGISISYFISPQLWAWREKRISVMRRCVDQILCIFPFEEAWYRERGVEATFVGHPFLDLPEPEVNREEFYERHDLRRGGTIIALMPGSRQQEIKRHLSVMVEAIRELRRRGHEIAPLIGKAPGVRLARHELGGIPVEGREPQLALRYADIGVLASGTVSLEAALYGTPSVVVYRMSPISWWLAQQFATVSLVSMTNLVAGEEILRELLQTEVTAENIVKEVEALLSSESLRQQIRKGLSLVRAKLGSPGAARRAAKLISEKISKQESECVA